MDDFIAGIKIIHPVGLLVVWFIYQIARGLYNVSPLHPLSHVPGPKLAAMSLLYEFWFDMIRGGTYTQRIKEMHRVYGPLVRIGPDELHCNDPTFIDEIYASSGRKRNKQAHFLGVLVGLTRNTSFGAIDHDLHRIRRNAMNKFFSRAQIIKLEPEMRRLTHLLCDKILKQPRSTPFDITTAYSCFSTDMISAYCFGEPIGLIEQDGWEPNFREPMSAFLNTAFFFRFFPWARGLADAAPLLAPYLSGDVGVLLREMYINTPKRVQQALNDHKNGVVRDRPTVFSDILASPLPDREKSADRLSGEAFSLTGAGTETTAWTLSVLAYHVLSRPSVQSKMTEELQGIDLQSASWVELEKLPYLSAVIAESLRLSYGISSRTPRIAPLEHLVYRGRLNGDSDVEYVLPKGTAVGMSSAIMHHNEDIFPNSNVFDPERWTNASEAERHMMERCLLAFSKGSRQCVGINLAYCELYMATAALVLRVFPHMELFETTVDDVEYDHDLVTAQAKKGSKGVRVVICE